jgi:hypothetical protein
LIGVSVRYLPLRRSKSDLGVESCAMSSWNPTPPGWTSTPKAARWSWRVTRGDRVMSSELRGESRSGAGWDVVIRQDGELSFSRRCRDESVARFVAAALKQDHVKAGWTEKGGA